MRLLKIKLELKGLPCHTEPVFESSSSSTVHLVDAHFPAGSVWGHLLLVHQYWCTGIGVLQCIGLLTLVNISYILVLCLGCHLYLRRRMNEFIYLDNLQQLLLFGGIIPNTF